VEPFRLEFRLSRRQRLAVELVPWVPAIAGTLGFGTGAAFLVTNVSVWFFPFLLLPVIVYRGLFAFAFEIIARAGRPIELLVGDSEMELRSCGEVKLLPLDGIFQMFRADDVWTVLHLDGSLLTIPVDAITAEQVEYLKSFARRAAAARAETHSSTERLH
jgi:hypothetical protein